ncbi:hypothetical protein KQI36_14620 [Clostridium senegalense]|uniref:hypothetical protein n=1 Tax=Clostridium senegalense TaxID=1465809 RepID=UPI001C10A135|nr:hypothetical protein [Clostridium senegalense]MBU5227865.1 hypothetical protein [Clostridium senegalense]
MLKEYGQRIIFDKKTGFILNGTFGKMRGEYLSDNLRPEEIDFIDLPYDYDDNNFNEAIEYHIDISKDKNITELKDLIIIDKYIERKETEEEKLRREKEELENQLLLKENKDLGGIL